MHNQAEEIGEKVDFKKWDRKIHEYHSNVFLLKKNMLPFFLFMYNSQSVEVGIFHYYFCYFYIYCILWS